jgi:hypothetical protein
MRRIAISCFALAIFATPAFAQGNSPAAAPAKVCASAPVLERGGTVVEKADQQELIARGLEATQTVKALLLAPEPLQAAQWCLEEDAFAHAKSLNRWRNAAAGPSGALTDRLVNFKGNSTIYVIRVAEGSTLHPDGPGYREVRNYAAILDQPDMLIVMGYFMGRPSTQEILEHMTVRVKITKADGKSSISVPK